MSGRKKYWKQAPEQPHERWRPPLMFYVGDEDAEVEEEIMKTLAAHGYSAPRGFRIRLWPPRG